MGDKCEVFLEKEEYAPGEIINGRVECNFASQNKVKGIRLKISGDAKVFWKISAFTYRRAQEVFFETDLDLLENEMTFPPGTYTYPFTYTLPSTVPSSMMEGDPTYKKTVASYVVPFNLVDVYYGCVQYIIKVTIERSWSTNISIEKLFKVMSSLDLTTISGLEKSYELSIGKRPSSLFKDTGPITATIQMPRSGYVPGEKLPFSVYVKNASSIDIQYIQFKFVQGFVFHAEQSTKSIDTMMGEEFMLKESDVAVGNERSWKLELVVPSMFLGNYSHCSVIKNFWELRGEICLPFPNPAFNVSVPITVGSVALTKRP
ncbi:arrestin domain-containing protein 3-like isoform X2 [Photinus pyralis]|uniref:arrestin domain-containing protein 3-like isoform X2 n=1 Tax=Photinus pyralis TaxID=7054 RepID=UPI001266F9BF|nr:arrestin domain-containing protein 3-like isoform X2 [Photinus pyralis]